MNENTSPDRLDNDRRRFLKKMGLAAFAVPAIATFSTSGIAAWAGSPLQDGVTTTSGEPGVTTTSGEPGVTTTSGEPRVTTTSGEPGVTTTSGETTTTTTSPTTVSTDPAVAATAVSANPTYTG